MGVFRNMWKSLGIIEKLLPWVSYVLVWTISSLRYLSSRVALEIMPTKRLLATTGHAEQPLGVHFSQYVREVGVRKHRFHVRVHDLADQDRVVHIMRLKQVGAYVVQMDQAHEFPGLLVFDREKVSSGDFHDFHEIPQGHVLRHGRAVLFQEFLDTQVGEDPGVGAGSQKVPLVHQLLQINKEAGLDVVAQCAG